MRRIAVKGVVKALRGAAVEVRYQYFSFYQFVMSGENGPVINLSEDFSDETTAAMLAYLQSTTNSHEELQEQFRLACGGVRRDTYLVDRGKEGEQFIASNLEPAFKSHLIRMLGKVL